MCSYYACPQERIRLTTPPSDTVQPNPFGSLLRSRKFLVAMLDLAASSALYFGGKYVSADQTDVVFLVGVLQPVFLVVIHGITTEDAAKTQANAVVEVAQVTAMVDSATPQVASGPIAESRGLGGWPPKPLTEQDLTPGQSRAWPPDRSPDRPIEPRR